MNRIEKVREYVDTVLLNMSDAFERRCAYLHLYGVSQACAMIALKRNENVDLNRREDNYYEKKLWSKTHNIPAACAYFVGYSFKK